MANPEDKDTIPESESTPVETVPSPEAAQEIKSMNVHDAIAEARRYVDALPNDVLYLGRNRRYLQAYFRRELARIERKLSDRNDKRGRPVPLQSNENLLNEVRIVQNKIAAAEKSLKGVKALSPEPEAGGQSVAFLNNKEARIIQPLVNELHQLASEIPLFIAKLPDDFTKQLHDGSTYNKDQIKNYFATTIEKIKKAITEKVEAGTVDALFYQKVKKSVDALHSDWWKLIKAFRQNEKMVTPPPVTSTPPVASEPLPVAASSEPASPVAADPFAAAAMRVQSPQERPAVSDYSWTDERDSPTLKNIRGSLEEKIRKATSGDAAADTLLSEATKKLTNELAALNAFITIIEQEEAARSVVSPTPAEATPAPSVVSLAPPVETVPRAKKELLALSYSSELAFATPPAPLEASSSPLPSRRNWRETIASIGAALFQRRGSSAVGKIGWFAAKELGAKTLGSIFGVRSLYDVPMYGIEKWKRSGILKDTLFSLYTAVETGEDNDRNDRIDATVKDLQNRLQESGLPAIDQTNFQNKIENIRARYTKASDVEKTARAVAFTVLLEQTIETNIKGVQALRETLNTALVLTGASGLRALAYGSLALYERYTRVQKEKGEDMRIFKNVFVDGARETFFALGGQGKTKELPKLQKAMAVLKAWGTVGRGVAIAGIGLHPEALTMGQFSNVSFDKIDDNFIANAKRFLSLVNGDAFKQWYKMLETKLAGGAAAAGGGVAAAGVTTPEAPAPPDITAGARVGFSEHASHDRSSLPVLLAREQGGGGGSVSVETQRFGTADTAVHLEKIRGVSGDIHIEYTSEARDAMQKAGIHFDEKYGGFKLDHGDNNIFIGADRDANNIIDTEQIKITTTTRDGASFLQIEVADHVEQSVRNVNRIFIPMAGESAGEYTGIHEGNVEHIAASADVQSYVRDNGTATARVDIDNDEKLDEVTRLHLHEYQRDVTTYVTESIAEVRTADGVVLHTTIVDADSSGGIDATDTAQQQYEVFEEGNTTTAIGMFDSGKGFSYANLEETARIMGKTAPAHSVDAAHTLLAELANNPYAVQDSVIHFWDGSHVQSADFGIDDATIALDLNTRLITIQRLEEYADFSYHNGAYGSFDRAQVIASSALEYKNGAWKVGDQTLNDFKRSVADKVFEKNISDNFSWYNEHEDAATALGISREGNHLNLYYFNKDKLSALFEDNNKLALCKTGDGFDAAKLSYALEHTDVTAPDLGAVFENTATFNNRLHASFTFEQFDALKNGLGDSFKPVINAESYTFTKDNMPFSLDKTGVHLLDRTGYAQQFALTGDPAETSVAWDHFDQRTFEGRMKILTDRAKFEEENAQKLFDAVAVMGKEDVDVLTVLSMRYGDFQNREDFLDTLDIAPYRKLNPLSWFGPGVSAARAHRQLAGLFGELLKGLVPDPNKTVAENLRAAIENRYQFSSS